MGANEKDLKSLKVYGNDDPAGSVYKVSGGGGESGSGLVLYVAEEEVDNETIQYLTHKDSSIATWREIHDALIEELPVSCMKIHGTSPLQPKLRGPSGGGEVPADLYYVERWSVIAAEYATYEESPFFSVTVDTGLTTKSHFGALTADDRLESAQ